MEEGYFCTRPVADKTDSGANLLILSRSGR